MLKMNLMKSLNFNLWRENVSPLSQFEIKNILSFIALQILNLPYLLLSGDNTQNAPTREELEQELSELQEEREIINNAHSNAGDKDDEAVEDVLGEMLEKIDKQIENVIEMINDINNNT